MAQLNHDQAKGATGKLKKKPRKQTAGNCFQCGVQGHKRFNCLALKGKNNPLKKLLTQIEKMSSKEAKGSVGPVSDKSAATATEVDQKKRDKAVTVENDGDYESAPEDLTDFMVVDEADITDSEDEDFEVRSVATSDEEGESVRWDCPLYRRAPRTYKDKDFNPTEPDPRCKPRWRLAAYWPVYVGNFRMMKKNDSDYVCAYAAHKYFASKGLPSFMVFRFKDNFFTEYQKRVGFFDMLVYFCTKQDATRAITLCNRDLYHGHRLHAFDGRTPELFTKKSWRLRHVKAEDKLEIESNLEGYVERYGEVKCLVKHDLNAVLVQFGRATAKVEGKESWDFSGDPRLDAVPIVGPVPKQRFVEKDVIAELTKEIDENPKFMRGRTLYNMLESLKHGVIPEMTRSWENRPLDRDHNRPANPNQDLQHKQNQGIRHPTARRKRSDRAQQRIDNYKQIVANKPFQPRTQTRTRTRPRTRTRRGGVKRRSQSVG